MANDFNFKELEGLSKKEREYAISILKEISKDGSSKKYDNLIYGDYSEIPVTIEEFLHRPQYLGRALLSDDGKFTVFPYWEEVLKKIFPTNIDTAYNTAIFSGAIGLGKSTIAVIAILYQLYRMMCLKNPYAHYGLQEIDLITFAFINITIDAAKGVAWDKCQQMLQKSDWFMARGTLTKSANPIWQPPKGIELIVGSMPRHIIGRAVFSCLDGDTKILTNFGDKTLKELVGKSIKVASINQHEKIEYSNTCTVVPTKTSYDEYEIVLEDNTIIKCTPEHKLLLTNGQYKEAKDLTENDDIFYVTRNTNCFYYSKKIDIKSITKNVLDSPKQFYDVINANPYNNFLIKTNTGYIGSHNCFCDEISFQNNSDVEKQKKKAMQLVSSANARMQSRFMRGEKNPTLLLLASSKRTEQSFLETFIDNKKKNESKSTLIIDEPQWVIRTDKDSPNKFKVAVGNKFLSSEVLPLNISDQDLQVYRDRGFQILDVPMGYYENFIDDIDIALTDIAGISTTSSSRYIAGPRVAAIKTKDYKNPFTKEIITVGNGKDDTAQYSDFFDLSLIDPKLKSRPLYIHLDMSISGDKTGIAGVWIVGKKLPKAGQPESKDLIYQLAFSVSVKAPKGHQVSFEKNRQFIYWLKENGFNIRGTSSDTFQSYDTGQALKNKGFNYDIISVDRTKDNVCIPYQYLKSTIYEERLIMYENTLLTEELIGLERNNNSGKVDHSPSGINSKDQADAVCGAVYNASQHAEEYALEYGESLEGAILANTSNNQENDKKQITLDFEQELTKIFDNSRNKFDGFTDFGLGKATTYGTNDFIIL